MCVCHHRRPCRCRINSCLVLMTQASFVTTRDREMSATVADLVDAGRQSGPSAAV